MKKKESKKRKIEKLLDYNMNKKILEEISSKKFVFSSSSPRKRSIQKANLNVEQVIDIISKDVSFSKKSGGGIVVSENPVLKIERLSEETKAVTQNKGRLLIKIESILDSKFPYYIRFITVLMKIFVCIMFSTLHLRHLGGKYISKYILGLLIQYPDVCSTITGGILSNLGSLGLQLKNIPVIGYIIEFINHLTGGGLDIANKYLIKIGEYFQNNGHRATPYADFFNFMVKVAIEGQLDITSFSSWKDFLLTATGKQLQNRVVDALIGVVINMLCPTEKETCRYAKLIFRIAHFGNSIRAIALDFFEASLPLMKYYILNKGSMSVDGLCINICYGLYESGHAITNSTSLKDGDIRKRDLKEDMKLAYSTDPKYQEKRKDTFGSEETALTFYNDNNSKLLIDRLVDQKAFQKF